MNRYRKAIVAIVGAVVSILATQGVDVDDATAQSFIALATALLVYVIPNE